MCNVSRFVAVLESDPGQPSTRHLAWSNYYGFHSSIFTSYAQSYQNQPPYHAPVERMGDYSDHCIHRFSDSRSRMGSEEVLVFNIFNQHQGVDTCLVELFGYYFGAVQPWVACQLKNLKSRGDWSIQVLRESDGTPLSTSHQAYVWGW